MLILVFDTLTFIFTVIAIVFLVAGWKRITGGDIRVLLSILLTVTIFYTFCMWLEWSGISAALDPYEDFSGALIPTIWAFLFYAYIRQMMIQDLRQSREQIIENEKRMELALNGADLGTWDWDTKTGKMMLNERWAEMLGYTSDEILPHISSWEALIHPEDLPGVMDKLNAHLRGETVSYETEHRLKNKQGQWIWVLDRGRVIERDNQGEPIRACGTHLDINDKKRFDAQIRQVQRIEAVGRLAGGIAHDLNNLLSPILGFGEVLTDDTDLNTEQREVIKKMLEAGFRARDLVHQLLAFCRRQPMEFKTVDLNEIIEDFTQLLRRIISEDIEIKIVKTPHMPPVNADVGQIEQIIMNLAINAADAMPDGGRLTIETGRHELDETYAATRPSVEPGQYAMLAISDQGQGMEPAVRDHIFEPFFTTKGEHGTGLGLATVFGIVKQHNGNIWLYSEPGRGTTFKIYLPVTQDVSYAPPATPEGIGIDLQGTETILLTEDNEPVRHLTKAILERYEYAVIAAKNGEEALAALTAHQGPVHLLLTDVILPGMNGRELYEKAIQYYPDLKVLYMSGYTDDIIAQHAVLGKKIQFIQKPFSVKGLAHKIKQALSTNTD
ncbi:MAG: PAS domain-containing protein [Thermodesulfobacteriota bacterium]|nr:PAS domain-containing protein [Thermodesulfobacteriota bacterium]